MCKYHGLLLCSLAGCEGNLELLRSGLVEVSWSTLVQSWWMGRYVELLRSDLVRVWWRDVVKPWWSIIVELLRSGRVEVLLYDIVIPL